MKYRDLIQFDPIDEIIKFSKLGSDDYREKLVRDFVCSKAYEEIIIPQICAKLDLASTKETKGIQIVGNYGTGKSHLMSLFTIIAEDDKYLNMLKSTAAQKWLKTIAGKYKVYRFELGNFQELWDVVTYKIDTALQAWGVDYSISNDTTPATYSEKLEKMMAAFEAVYPDKGFMLVIDEMLSYLKGRSQPDKLNRDLAVLQALGQMSDRTHFRMVFGVQELIYRSPEFQFAKEMLGHVNERYVDLTIQKEDVQFIVQQRLLLKNEHQRSSIRQHLKQFAAMFPHMNNNLETYVSLFPVHPTYFDNFSLIRIGKSQREVLKTLSKKFESIMEEEVPTDQPGLICYDSYWQDMLNNVDLKADPNVSRVSDITALIDQKIEDNFTRGLAPKKKLAHRIVAAAAIKMLQADLSHCNGVTAEALANDLCHVDATCDSYDELVDVVISNLLNKIVSATIGQYFEKGEDKEYHIRIEGGVNYEQKVKDYASQMGDSQRDEYFFSFLSEVLPVEGNSYRTTFRIWEHSIEWRSHHCYRKGYIFMGNPNERSTTQPEQHFYLYFMPLFNGQGYQREPLGDSIYFLMDKLSEEFRTAVTLYGSALAQEGSASSDEKPRYKQLRDKYYKEARDKFNNEFLSATTVEYLGEQHPLQGMPGTDADSKIDTISGIASYIMDKQFEAENPDYPKFEMLSAPLTQSNRKGLIDNALRKIADPTSQNRNGEAMLMALGLWEDGHLSTLHSRYARSLKAKLDEKGGQVLNRDEILELFWAETYDYHSKDFRIEADLEMLVMATMAALGEIEIVLKGGNRINASSIANILSLNSTDYYNYANICPPKGLNLPLIREILVGLLGVDRTAELDDKNTSLFADMISAAKQMEEKVVRLQHRIRGGYRLGDNIEIISSQQASEKQILWDRLKGMCNQLQRYNSKAKLGNLDWTVDFVHETMTDIKQGVEDIEVLLEEMNNFKSDVSYFYQALGNITDPAPYDPSLRTDIQKALEALPQVVTADRNARERFKQNLQSLRERYADYYMDAYTQAHIPELEEVEKNALLAKDEYKTCKSIQESADFINPASFEALVQKLQSLRVANPHVTRESILSVATGSDGFRPSAVEKEKPSVAELAQELMTIYAEYVQQFQDALDDPTAARNVEMLTADEKALLDSFKKGNISLTQPYAKPLAAIINKLQHSFHRVSLTHEELVKQFNRPMKVDEAMQVFKQLIDEQCRGKRIDDVRIIIK